MSQYGEQLTRKFVKTDYNKILPISECIPRIILYSNKFPIQVPLIGKKDRREATFDCSAIPNQSQINTLLEKLFAEQFKMQTDKN